MKINIYDVAREANVSIATVSRVLNNKPNVSPATRERILETLTKLNYQPSAIARGLVLNRTQTVGILTIDIRTPHYSSTAYAMERDLFKLGYGTILCNTGGDIKDNIKYIHMLVNKGVSGILSIGSVFKSTFTNSSILSECPNIPFVMCHCIINAENAYSVVVDEQEGLRLCVNHLLEKGHRNIVYVKDADSFSACEKPRYFLHWMSVAGLSFNEKSVFGTARSIEGGGIAADKILQSGIKCSAIIAGDDLTAIGIIKRLKQLKYSIPRDFAVIGQNNSIAAICCDPALTTVDYKTDTIGTLTVKLLEMVLTGGEKPRLLTASPELIVREST